MNDSLYIAATGMQMQQASVDSIANNLANVNTTGYKKSRVSFQDLVYRDLSAGVAGATGAPALWQGSGVGMAGILKSFAPGELKQTGQALDVAIRGAGFFEVSAADGTPAFTRGGALKVDADGFLATVDGYVLKPAIHLGQEARNVVMSADGTVTAQLVEGATPTEVGRLELVRFSDDSGLDALGNGLYRPTERSGDAIHAQAGADGMGSVAQGFLEGANVNMVEEMVNLMVAQRAYESSVKVIQASDEMLAMSNNLRK